MPEPQQRTIRDGLSAFDAVRASGKDGWVSFESGGGGGWIEYAPDTLNMDWPFRREPDADFIASFLQPLGSVERLTWDIDTYATFKTPCRDWNTLTRVIDDLFCRLYDLGQEYSLTWKVQEL
jgi:hypothetical protein